MNLDKSSRGQQINAVCHERMAVLLSYTQQRRVHQTRVFSMPRTWALRTSLVNYTDAMNRTSKIFAITGTRSSILRQPDETRDYALHHQNPADAAAEQRNVIPPQHTTPNTSSQSLPHLTQNQA